jgi:hypothetical protein
MAQLELKEVKIEILQVLEVIRDPQEFDRTDATAKYILNLSYEIDNLGVRQLKISTRDFSIAIWRAFIKLKPAHREYVIHRVLPKIVSKLRAAPGNAPAFAVEINKFVSQLKLAKPGQKGSKS